jgi:hypothetical protein
MKNKLYKSPQPQNLMTLVSIAAELFTLKKKQPPNPCGMSSS